MTEEKIESVEKKSDKPSWVKMKKEELEKIVLALEKEGKTPAQIGLVLRDKYGIPKSKLLGRKVTHILKDAEVDYKSDKGIVEENVAVLRKHISKNKHDYSASKSLTKKLWALKRLEA